MKKKNKLTYMNEEFRIILNGEYLPFTCQNNKYKTNIKKGYKHNINEHYLGSATKKYIFKNEGGSSLWLEHAIGIKNVKDKVLWLMWYDKKGNPITIMSAVFDKDDLLEIIKNITRIHF